MSNPVSLPANQRRHPAAAPVHDPAADARLDAGVALFNEGQHWHAHEEWEPLWMGLEGEDKLFVQGLIMAAAMLVQYEKGVVRGVLNHHANVKARLPGNRWGIDIQGLLAQLAHYAADAETGHLGTSRREAGEVQITRIRTGPFK